MVNTGSFNNRCTIGPRYPQGGKLPDPICRPVAHHNISDFLENSYPKVTCQRSSKSQVQSQSQDIFRPGGQTWCQVYGGPNSTSNSKRYGLVTQNLKYWKNNYGILEKPFPLFQPCYYKTREPVTTCGYRPNDHYYSKYGGDVDTTNFGFIPNDRQESDTCSQNAIQVGYSVLDWNNGLAIQNASQLYHDQLLGHNPGCICKLAKAKRKKHKRTSQSS